MLWKNGHWSRRVWWPHKQGKCKNSMRWIVDKENQIWKQNVYYFQLFMTSQVCRSFFVQKCPFSLLFFIFKLYSRLIALALVQSSFHTTKASLVEMELELNSLDWNVNELKHKLELEDMKPTKKHFFYTEIQCFS